mmetsp:Transcript_6833/g.15607  ORF Transcript_6833/g.15607 Transcript_6833/m.15607 type:complete len:99 (-) Transcript_6833:228-524(-)
MAGIDDELLAARVALAAALAVAAGARRDDGGGDGDAPEDGAEEGASEEDAAAGGAMENFHATLAPGLCPKVCSSVFKTKGREASNPNDKEHTFVLPSL